ncbi:MAG: hypothetical protein L6R36_002498 [Xanthoria steineri]|nr:MAG: hypothetical protein L6R36_002498 [Xanthoria steineri]
MAAEKRPASNAFGSSQLVVKRQKSNVNLSDGRALAVTNGNASGGALIHSVPRTSGLQSPIMELTGHTGEVFATRFDTAGHLIASGSMDRSIMLWRTYGECDNFGVLTGHKGAILDLQWSRDSRVLFSASADTTVASWDLESGLRIRRHEGHEEVINCLDVSKRGEEILVSGSDDGYICIWDPRKKRSIDEMETGFPVTSVALAEAGNELYSGGIDNEIKVWDMRKQSVIYTLSGHTDTVTSLQPSPDAQALLSYSHDGTARTWDIRPFAPVTRQMKSYVGAPPGLEKNLVRASWNSKGDRIAAGSGDGTAVVWDAPSAKLLYKLPGHRGTVNDVRFAPGDEPIIVSGSSDRNLILGELGT